MCKIPTWVVWVNGIKHPRTFQALVHTILIVHVLFYLWHFQHLNLVIFNFWKLQKVKVELVFSLGPINFRKIALNDHIDVNMVRLFSATQD